MSSALAADGGVPLRGVGPGQLGAELRVGDLGQVDADRASAHRAHHERHGQRDQRCVVGSQRGQRPGDVHVRGIEHARLVERAEQPVGALRQPQVVRVLQLR